MQYENFHLLIQYVINNSVTVLIEQSPVYTSCTYIQNYLLQLILANEGNNVSGYRVHIARVFSIENSQA